MLVYSSCLLSRFLDPKNQPEEVKEYLEREDRFLLDSIAQGSTLADFGCGFGRHLELLKGRLSYGLGIDNNEKDILVGRRRLKDCPNLELKVADVRDPRLERIFDYAVCMNNTLGNIEEKQKVIDEMQKAIVPEGLILAGVYSEKSIQPRIRWYENVGLHIKDITERHILTEEGFKSGHFRVEDLARLFGPCCRIEKTGEFGFFVIERKS